MNEIGSDFHIVNAEKNVEVNIFRYLKTFHTQFYDSGRSALKALLTHIPAKRVLLPGYICESVRDCFNTNEVFYYKINKEMKICWKDVLNKAKNNIDIVYLHFFNGYIDASYNFEELIELQKIYKFLIIEDTTHSLFTNKNIVGDYCVCSLRKWFPVPDGGVLYSAKNKLPLKCLEQNEWFSVRYKAMQLKTMYLTGKQIDKADFLAIFAEAEKALDEQENIYRLSNISKKLLEKIDVKKMINARCRNVEYLNDYFQKTHIKNVSMGQSGQVPLFYTLLVQNRDDIRRMLIDNKIYCPVHWPLYSEIENISSSIYINLHELSIPIDQRYSYGDMQYIADIFRKWEETNDSTYKLERKRKME